MLSRLLSTNADDRIRDAKRALDLAERAVRLTRGEVAATLHAFAVALAEAGYLGEAAVKPAQALELAKAQAPDAVPTIERHLESIRKGWPIRESLDR